MTSVGSPRRDPGEELAALLHGLRYRGLAVGVDDAARVARLFRHAATWPHQRRVRALKMLLARSNAERDLIDQLAPFLFVDAEKRTEHREEKTATTPLGQTLPGSQWESTRTADQHEVQQSQTPIETPGGTTRRHLGDWRRQWWLVSVGLAAAILAVWLIRQCPPPTTQPDIPPTPTATAVATAPVTAVAAATPLPEQPEVDREDIPTSSPPSPPWWPFLLVDLLSVLLVWMVVRRYDRTRRQRLNIEMVAASPGRRSYRLQLPVERRGTPRDKLLIRDAAFQLSAPTAEARANWLDSERTVEVTAREAGLLSLRWASWLEHRPLLLIEDIAPSMARWPGVAEQLFQALQHQGSEVRRLYMAGTPLALFSDRSRQRPVQLEKVLAAMDEPVVVVVSDARALDSQRARQYAVGRWLGMLGQATWLTPGNAESWDSGARWLAGRRQVTPMTRNSLLRFGRASGAEGSDRQRSRWQQPRCIGDQAELRVVSLRAALGEDAFWWLAAGAVLDKVRALTTELWWALSSEGVATVPDELAHRVLSLSDLSIATDGTVRIAGDLREALVATTCTDNPQLLSAVVAWAEAIINDDLRCLADAPLAAVQAQVLRVELLFLDPTRHRHACRQEHGLARDGFGEWFSAEQAPPQQSYSGVRTNRTKPPTWPARVVAVTLLLLACMATSILFMPHFPQDALQRSTPLPRPTADPTSRPAATPAPNSTETPAASPTPIAGLTIPLSATPKATEPLPPTVGSTTPTVTQTERMGYERDVWVDPTTGMRFRHIPAGTFTMGSPEDEVGREDDETQHPVMITRGFWMGETEVTQRQWLLLMESNPSYFGDCSDCPVENVSWFDAVRYANTLSRAGGLDECYRIDGESVAFTGLTCEGYRLPTEAEWEYAARAGTTTPFTFGENLTTDQVNYDGQNPYSNNPEGEFRARTVPAGTLPPNGWGLFEVHGNVFEWCQDWYAVYPEEGQADPVGPEQGSYRVLRGGSWFDDGRYARAAFRRYWSPDFHLHSVGFRLVRGPAALDEDPPGSGGFHPISYGISAVRSGGSQG